MKRAKATAADSLRQEAEGTELYAANLDVSPERLEEYWDLSSALMALVSEIDEYATNDGTGDSDDPELLAYRRRLRRIVSQLSQLEMP